MIDIKQTVTRDIDDIEDVTTTNIIIIFLFFELADVIKCFFFRVDNKWLG